MRGHEFERPVTRERRNVDLRRVSAYARFDGGGGVEVTVSVPCEPPAADVDQALAPGALATIKLWTRGVDEPQFARALGAPVAVRSEPTPARVEMPGSGYDPHRPPRYYAISVLVVVGFDVVDAFQGLFDPTDGSDVSDRVTPF